MKDREIITSNGKAVFYAAIYEDLKNAALDVGWALGIHGSLASDMDIMAMAWTEDATDIHGFIDAIRNCFTEPLEIGLNFDDKSKPNNRVVITLSIWSDFYLDINVIKGNYEKLRLD